MDPARAAAMSDPDLNPLFRRHWVEPVAIKPQPAADAIPRDPLEQSGLDLLLAWRRQKAEGAAR
jgi:hypothetical protein